MGRRDSLFVFFRDTLANAFDSIKVSYPNGQFEDFYTQFRHEIFKPIIKLPYNKKYIRKKNGFDFTILTIDKNNIIRVC